ncbi:hypothetical protein Hanom_Chr17g01527691 [Helianthus anomalus]
MEREQGSRLCVCGERVEKMREYLILCVCLYRLQIDPFIKMLMRSYKILCAPIMISTIFCGDLFRFW